MNTYTKRKTHTSHQIHATVHYCVLNARQDQKEEKKEINNLPIGYP